jgi:isopentenyl-diphosphate delta-isomerase
VPTLNIVKRKFEHIEISLREDVVYPDNCIDLYEEVILIHQAIPGLSLSDIDLTTHFLGYELHAPLVIEGMTGGHPDLGKLNENFAKLASEFKIALGLGSQRPIVIHGFNQEVVETYRIARRVATDVPLIGNIGISQLGELEVEEIRKLVESINADALAIHLNPAQEIIQAEGDTYFKDELIERVRELVKELGAPIIIKEVGNGLSMEIVAKFRDVGVDIFDIAGACGTNWIAIEALRNPEDALKRSLGLSLSRVKWGIPTPLSLIETRYAAPSSTIIGSGGVWNGIYAAKLIALGADLVGFARPILKAFMTGGYEAMKRYVELYISELKAAMFLVGASSVKELRRKPVVLGIKIRNYIQQRGIDPDLYISRFRLGFTR